ncbi:MAG: efflux transporter outer membrane subunit [Firmicutes bacterium]|nr:efflux transporter outer membrane subunit [Bacillota bacterium]MCM1401178.1 efflux transporter outer membrane subunit [Bacteroides sp.]MCM1477125.1 efflux transporter outer membrane subunit [Bacteroides sp.]
MRPFQPLLFALVALAALIPGRGYAAPDIPTLADSVPERWQYITKNLQTVPTDDRWWQSFSDPVLDSLIAIAVDRNYNVLAAIHRIEMARQTVRQTRSGYYPTLGLSAGWTKERSSGRLAPSGRVSTVDYFSAGVNMSWEIDVFGRIAARTREAKSQYNVTRAEYAATMVSLCGELAQNYAALRTAQARLAVAKAHILLQDSVLHIAQARFEAQLASKLDVEQASTTYYATVASIPTIEATVSTSINAIAVLLGEFPETVAARLSVPAPLPDHRQIVAVGVPMELIRRRPDVVEAECQLAAAAQAVGVAKKDFLPTLSLQGSIGTEAHNIGDLFSSKSFTYSIAPTISWTIFDGFSRSAALASAREQVKASVDSYNMAILTAVQEADNAMVNYNSALKEAELTEDVLEHAQRAFELSLELYRSGLSSFTNLSDSQISFLQYADQLVTARGNALTALISLYEALGGGWTESI